MGKCVRVGRCSSTDQYRRGGRAVKHYGHEMEAWRLLLGRNDLVIVHTLPPDVTNDGNQAA